MPTKELAPEKAAVHAPASPGAAEAPWSRFGTGFLPEIAALVVILIWGSTFTLTKTAYDEFQPLAFGFVRFILITLIAFVVLTFQARRQPDMEWWRIRRSDLPMFVITGLLGYTFYQLGFMIGLEHTSPFSSSLMVALQPIVVLGVVTLLGERQPVMVWLGVLVSLAGVAMFLANDQGESQWLGNVITFLGGASLALYTVFNRRLVREYPAETYAAYSTLFGAVPLLLVSLPQALSQDWGAVSVQSWLTLMYMAIFPVYLAYIVWLWVIQKRGVAVSGLNLLVPLIAGVLSILFFGGEDFGPLKIAGGALALAGMLVMQRANRRANRQGS